MQAVAVSSLSSNGAAEKCQRTEGLQAHSLRSRVSNEEHPRMAILIFDAVQVAYAPHLEARCKLASSE